MKIIISPAKKMKIDTESPWQTFPAFMNETQEIMDWIKALDYEAAKAMWKCNDQIASQNFDRFKQMNLTGELTPAILSYEGIAYQYMAPSVFEYGEFDYVQENLRILSAFYGVVKPLDGVRPYRLEMQAKAAIGAHKNLYDYWGRKLYDAVMDESHIVINLASKEYSKCIEKYLTEQDRFITCVFGEWDGKKVVQKGVYAKMARGEMVRFMAQKKIYDPEEIKNFDHLGYHFEHSRSDDHVYVFLKK